MSTSPETKLPTGPVKSATAAPTDPSTTTTTTKKNPAPTSPPRELGFGEPLPFPSLKLFQKDRTILHALAKEPSVAPKKHAKHLFPQPFILTKFYKRFSIKRDLVKGRVWTRSELDEAYERGNFPRRPSDLFLRIYSDVILCLTRDPLAGNVSPALIGTSGTIPLSIVSTIPDIMMHYHDCIVLAEKEVFLVTNYWQPSDSVNKISEGIRTLNERIEKRKGEKVVLKIMWDRGDVKQLIKHHVSVQPATWVPLGLPSPEEVPNLSIQVINFHKPLLGTFHQKAMVVDRKVALLNSNNIQDRPNVEMMVHLEGPVVDSIYDTLLLSWHEKFSPTLPCIGQAPYYPNPSSSTSDTSPSGSEKVHDQQDNKTSAPSSKYLFSDSNPYLAHIDVIKAAKAARKLLLKQNKAAMEAPSSKHSSEGGARWWDYRAQPSSKAENLPQDEDDKAAAAAAPAGVDSNTQEQSKADLSPETQATQTTSTEFTNTGDKKPGSSGDAIPESTPPPAKKKGSGFADLVSQAVDKNKAEKLGTKAQTSAGDDKGDEEKIKSGTEELSGNGVDGTKKGDSNGSAGGNSSPPSQGETKEDADEMKRKHASSVSSTTSNSRMAALSASLNAGAIKKVDSAIEDETLIHDFKPHLIHRAHDPFPIAMVNRRPHGMPGHQDVRVPQDAAWLAGLRYAQDNVFIQTPTLNAAPIVRAVIEACSNGGADKEGIQVTLFLDLGFNDKGESVPFQGGTNEEVVLRLYKALTPLGKENNLHVYWYTGKDQIKPLNAVHKSRNCHIKFMSIDGQCGILGNGNQDTQSWFHSQEMNILIDDPAIVASWLDQLQTNQSTEQFGKVDTDGIWRDPKTKEPLQAPDKISCFTAIAAMI